LSKTCLKLNKKFILLNLKTEDFVFASILCNHDSDHFLAGSACTA
jgi:hypothetical protein